MIVITNLLPWSLVQISVKPDHNKAVTISQNVRCFPDEIFKRILTKERVCILGKISMRLYGLTDNNSAGTQLMAWCRTGNEPLPESMMTRFTDAHMRKQASISWSTSY